jgi:hypothetical protein
MMWHPKIRSKLQEIWEHSDVDGNGTLDRQEYFQMHKYMWLAVQGKSGERHMQKQRKSAKIDWELDKVKGKNYLDRQHFIKSWFLLADSFTDSVSVDDYFHFLSNTHEKMKKYESLENAAKQNRASRRSAKREKGTRAMGGDMAHRKARDRALAMMREKLAREAKLAADNKAANKIQTWWKQCGERKRHQIKEAREKQARENSAAVIIQTAVRRSIQRKKDKARRRAAKTGQKKHRRRSKKLGWELPQRIVEHRKHCLGGASCCICWNYFPEASAAYTGKQTKPLKQVRPKANACAISIPTHPTQSDTTNANADSSIDIVTRLAKSLSNPTLASAPMVNAVGGVIQTSISTMDRKGNGLSRSPVGLLGNRRLNLGLGVGLPQSQKDNSRGSPTNASFQKAGTQPHQGKSRLMVRLGGTNKTKRMGSLSMLPGGSSNPRKGSFT